jgi:hypothetical protein
MEQTAPERDLHRTENADREKVRKTVIWKLLARIDRHLPEFR